MKNFTPLLTILFLFSTTCLAQDCGCDFYIETTDDIFDGAAVAPGQVVCLEAGERGRLRIMNLEGSLLNPIEIRNCGGTVAINAAGASFGLRLQACDYFHISGTGEDDVLNGIRIDDSNGFGIRVTDLSNHFKVDHISIENTVHSAFQLRDNPTCDLTANEGFFELEDCTLSDLVINNCGDGIAIGHPQYRLGFFDGGCGALFPYGIDNLTIENCVISNIHGGNGISLFGANAIIKNNEIDEVNGIGIDLFMESQVTVEKNRILNTNHYGLRAEKGGFFDVFNNLFGNNGAVGTGAVFAELFTLEGELDHNRITFLHNTVVNSGTYNLIIENAENASEECLIQNNIFVTPYVVEPDLFEFAPYLSFTPSDWIEVSNNTYSATAAEQHFVDEAAGDYRLTHSSIGLNYGLESGLSEDLMNETRNLAGAPDAGAFEYVPEPIAYFERIPLVGLYVDDFKNILGNEVAETQLLDFAQENGFNYLLLYNLSYINTHKYDLTDPDEAIVLANFIVRAKKEYGMVQVGAVGEKNASFDKIEIFNTLFGDSWFQKIDVLNLEFEFWTDVLSDVFGYYCETYLAPGGYPCTNSGAFDFYSDELEAIDARADEMGIISEIYLGYTSDEESIALGERCDRILLHHYRTTDVYGDGSSIYNYHTYRIQAIALSDRKPAVMPIFSSRSYHMGPWLEDHSLHQPMETWLYGIDGYYDDDSEGVSELPISGNIWYRYTSFLDIGGEPHIRSQINEGGMESEIKILQNVERQEILVAIDLEVHDAHHFGQIHNLRGELILEFPLTENVNKVNTYDLSSGIYICSIADQNGILKTEKFVQP